MGLPVVPILSAVAPLVMSALDLYRRRSEARDVGFAEAGTAASAASRTPLQKRLEALEESDLEQARLLTDLTRQVEALAHVVETQARDQRQRESRWRVLLGASMSVAVVALVVAILAVSR